MSGKPPPESTPLETALAYARLGWCVIPLHSTEGAQCSCAKGAGCGTSAGKHPRTKDDLATATSSQAQIQTWWSRWPRSNVGLACQRSGFVAIDIDPRHGGDESWRDLLDRHGAVPETVRAVTGGGGTHYLFEHPLDEHGNHLSLKGTIAPGIDVKSDGLIVAEPSLHQSGRQYAWEADASPFDLELAPLPPWLLTMITATYRPNDWRSTPYDGPAAHLQRIQDGCAFIAHCFKDAPALSEPDWYAMLGIVGRCEDGIELAHEWSEVYPDYSRDETDKKLVHALKDAGPATCAFIEDRLNFDCRGCPHRGKVKSPIVLGSSAQGQFRAGWSRRGSAPQLEQVISARELQSMDLPEARWAVPSLLPQGLTILAGKPKAGKSWMALDIAIAVAAAGKVMGKMPVASERGEVLYLALEDSLRRLKNRLETILRDLRFPERLHFSTEWPRFDDGGADQLGNWLAEHPDARLVIIDTLARIRPARSRNANAYDEDYSHLGAIKHLADRYAVAILIIHHVRKMPSDDPLDLISGTLAIAGAADALLVLSKTGEAAGIDAKLFVRGRDMEDVDLALKWWRARTSWEIVGNWEEASVSGHKATILDALRDGPLGLKALSDATDIEYRTLDKTVRRLVRDGTLRKNGRSYDVVRNDRNESKWFGHSDVSTVRTTASSDNSDASDTEVLESGKATHAERPSCSIGGCKFPPIKAGLCFLHVPEAEVPVMAMATR